MTTGVHHSNFHIVIGRAFRRLEREVRFFGNGKSVHIRPNSDDGPRLSARQNAHDTRVGHAGLHFESQAPHVLRDALGGLELTISKLRILVESVPMRDDGILVLADRLLNPLLEGTSGWLCEGSKGTESDRQNSNNESNRVSHGRESIFILPTVAKKGRVTKMRMVRRYVGFYQAKLLTR